MNVGIQHATIDMDTYIDIYIYIYISYKIYRILLHFARPADRKRHAAVLPTAQGTLTKVGHPEEIAHERNENDNITVSWKAMK